MNKSLVLRDVEASDFKVLLEWRNEKITRKYSFESKVISNIDHDKYLTAATKNSSRSIFILEYNGLPIGTLKEDKIQNNVFEISYTISPKYRGMKFGQAMMRLYLLDRKGMFLCKVKDENIPSIMMLKKLGFKPSNREKKYNCLELTQG